VRRRGRLGAGEAEWRERLDSHGQLLLQGWPPGFVADDGSSRGRPPRRLLLLSPPDVTGGGIGEESLRAAKVRVGGRSGDYIGAIGRVDDRLRLGMRGAHPAVAVMAARPTIPRWHGARERERGKI
jgi:hypothetical protein